MNEFIKVFEIGDHQVAAICRGEGKEKDRWRFEQATYVDGVLINVVVEIPWPQYENVLETYDESRARGFLDTVFGLLECE